jgi:hypothetical protein
MEEKDWQYCTAANVKKMDWKYDYATKQASDKTSAENMFQNINKLWLNFCTISPTPILQSCLPLPYVTRRNIMQFTIQWKRRCELVRCSQLRETQFS